MKVADVKLHWVKSATPVEDISKVVMVLTKNGSETQIELSPSVEEYTLELKARDAVSFRIDTYDDEDNIVASETHSFQLGDLIAPQPATFLGHVVVGIRDVPDPVEE